MTWGDLGSWHSHSYPILAKCILNCLKNHSPDDHFRCSQHHMPMRICNLIIELHTLFHLIHNIYNKLIITKDIYLPHQVRLLIKMSLCKILQDVHHRQQLLVCSNRTPSSMVLRLWTYRYMLHVIQLFMFGCIKIIECIWCLADAIHFFQHSIHISTNASSQIIYYYQYITHHNQQIKQKSSPPLYEYY